MTEGASSSSHAAQPSSPALEDPEEAMKEVRRELSKMAFALDEHQKKNQQYQYASNRFDEKLRLIHTATKSMIAERPKATSAEADIVLTSYAHFIQSLIHK